MPEQSAPDAEVDDLIQRVQLAARDEVRRSSVREELRAVLHMPLRDVGDEDEDALPDALLSVLRQNNHWLQLDDLLPPAAPPRSDEPLNDGR